MPFLAPNTTFHTTNSIFFHPIKPSMVIEEVRAILHLKNAFVCENSFAAGGAENCWGNARPITLALVLQRINRVPNSALVSVLCNRLRSHAIRTRIVY